MRRRSDRYLVDLGAQLYLEGAQEHAAVQDISLTGMFVQTTTQVLVGAAVGLAISPEGRPVTTVGIVSHSLGRSEARAVGRAPGFGLAFRDPQTPSDELFAIAISRLIRAHRIANAEQPIERVVLCGALEHLALPALLTMLEQERKTGRLTLLAYATWIDLVDGRIVDAGPATGAHGALAAVLGALDCTRGTFEFATGIAAYVRTEIAVTQALLEHARVTDEALRRSNRHLVC
ncbi:MAG: DUF4388 domain-containing protein [Kofleriaceae bacterium]